VCHLCYLRKGSIYWKISSPPPRGKIAADVNWEKKYEKWKRKGGNVKERKEGERKKQKGERKREREK
jgi:hypothetical protein